MMRAIIIAVMAVAMVQSLPLRDFIDDVQITPGYGSVTPPIVAKLGNVNCKKCADGAVAITDAATCETAAKSLSKGYGGVQATTTRPKGCYICTATQRVYFNPSGDTADPLAQTVCQVPAVPAVVFPTGPIVTSSPRTSQTNSVTKAPIPSIVLPVESTQKPTTAEPTQAPTQKPTTAVPTQAPTQKPTTAAPTQAPTQKPTTAVPTQAPTQKPTTAAPTQAPTQKPTTAAPTQAPTQKPTLPTAKPTAAPTRAPFALTVATLSPRTQSNSVTKAPIRSIDVHPAITEDDTEAPFEYIVNTDSPKRVAPPAYTPPAYTPPTTTGYGSLFPPPTTTTKTPPAYAPPTTTGYGSLFPPPTTTTKTPPATSTGYGSPPSAYGR